MLSMTDWICADCLTDNAKGDDVAAVTIYNGYAVCALHARGRDEQAGALSREISSHLGGHGIY
jgi:hypothetical protein